MKLTGLQLFVTNLSINSIFLLALDFMKTQYKIHRPLLVCQDAAPQPGDAALLSTVVRLEMGIISSEFYPY